MKLLQSKNFKTNLKRLKKHIKHDLKGEPPSAIKSFLNLFDPKLARLMEFKTFDNISRQELGALVKLYCLFDLNSEYGSLITQYDSNLNVEQVGEKFKRFITSGNGKGVLNSYRVLESGHEEVFEKIYFNDSDDLVRVEWFYQFVAPLLNESIVKFPMLKQIKRGSRLTRVLSECLPLRKSELGCRDSILDLVLYFQLIIVEVPQKYIPVVKDFRRSHIYREASEAIMRNYCFRHPLALIKLKFIEARIHRLPSRLTHGDLHLGNFSSPNIVIDWDEAGFYPIGFDLALTMSRYFHFDDFYDMQNFLRINASGSIDPNLYEMYKFSVLFFCLFFYERRDALNVKSSLKESIRNYLIRNMSVLEGN